MVKIVNSNYEKVSFLLIVTILIIILVNFLNEVALATIFLLTLLIIIIHKIHLEERIDKLIERGEEQHKRLEYISQVTDSILKSIEDFKREIWKSFFVIENKIETQRDDFEIKLYKQYRELAAKIIDIENKLNKTRKDLAMYVSYIEEKIEAD
jgi:hypothetical protein